MAGALTCCCLLVVLPVPSASASCAGPQELQVEQSRPGRAPSPTGSASPVLTSDGDIEVSGRGFADGCDDTTGGWGCDGPPPVVPMRGVDLVLEQDGTTWTLGTADAAGGDEGYAISWRVRVPAGAAPGPAVLRAATADEDVLVDG
ncbi:hypothetical protein GTR02_02600 [Kineococcus sp. R8]|uniref:hypothetical protein n=1 Tax=Kineococcus siccus TaxID=2696567 RepID=UPI001411D4F2|nr:hypothetical protein [Kineococcus siccus]NAZ80708.1 hypothetical protein [Kineococcus siccus]